jgi:hypothetical protein
VTGAAMAAAGASSVTSQSVAAMSVVIAPNPCTGTYNSSVGDYVVTSQAVANVTGGTPPYRYQWAYVSGFSGYGVTDLTQRQVSWSQNGPNDHLTTFMVTVTDAQNKVATAQVTVHFNPGGGDLAGGGGSGGGGAAPSVTIAPNPCVGYYDSRVGDYVITQHAVATPSGGTPPYRYQWDYVSGFTLYGVTDRTQPEIWWSQNGPNDHVTTFMVTVTDANNKTGTAQVTVHFNPGGLDAASGGGSGGTPGPAPTVTVTPPTITSHKPGGGTSTFTFSSTVSGGTGPYQYLWDEGDGSRTGPTVTFSKHAPADDEIDGVVTLTVRDATGAVGTATGQWFALGF